jgi:hypothetical protein
VPEEDRPLVLADGAIDRARHEPDLNLLKVPAACALRGTEGVENPEKASYDVAKLSAHDER